MQYRHFSIKRCQRLGLGAEFLQASLQHAQIIVVPTYEWTVAIGTYSAFGKLRARRAGCKAAFAALEPAGNAIAHGLFRHLEPDR